MTRGPDPDISALEILRFMVEDPDPGFTTNEVAEEFGKTRQWADHRLNKMVDNGLLEIKKSGRRSKWYWPSAKGKTKLREARG